MPDRTEYRLRSLKLPLVKGGPLRLAARLLEGPLRRMVLGRLMRQGGIAAIRQLRPSEPPTLLPVGESASVAEPGDVAELPEPDAVPDSSFCTVAELARAYRSGAVTPEDIATRSLAAIARLDEGARPLRAFISVDADDVMQQARASALRFGAGQALGILDGVPIAIKDEIDQLGHPTTTGTRCLGTRNAQRDATIVGRLRAAGAILIGKANMHEIGINPNGLNVHHGQVRNPYDRDHDSGGSSSGSAAAVAAGVCPVAIGADGGGSIRIPAALCGIVGLKATFARVSEDGATPLAWTVGHLGPVGASTHCVAAAYAAIAGPDPRDPCSLAQPAPSIDGWNAAGLEGVTVGVYRRWFEHATPEIVEACDRAVSQLADAGAVVREISVPGLEQMRIAHAVTILSEMATNMLNVRESLREFGAGTRVSLAIGRGFSSSEYLVAQRVRTRAMRTFAELYSSVDLIVTPATAVTAPKIIDGGSAGVSDLSTVTELMRFIVPGNLVGLPAIAVPIGYGQGGLPIGLQVMANHWREPLLLRTSLVLERHAELQPPAGYEHLVDDRVLGSS